MHRRLLLGLAAVLAAGFLGRLVISHLDGSSTNGVSSLEPLSSRATNQDPGAAVAATDARSRPSSSTSVGALDVTRADASRSRAKGRILSGRVVDEDGKGVRANVMIGDEFESIRRTVSDEATGAFEIENVPVGSWKFFAAAAGYGLESATLDVPERSGDLTLDVILIALRRVYVRFVEPGGGPLRDSGSAPLTSGSTSLELSKRVNVFASFRAFEKEVPVLYVAAGGGDMGQFKFQQETLTTPDGKSFESDGVLTISEPGPLTVYANHGHTIVGQAPLIPGVLFIDLPLDLEGIQRAYAGVKLRVVDDSSGQAVTFGSAMILNGFTHLPGVDLGDVGGAVHFEKLRPGVWYLTLNLRRGSGGYGTITKTLLLTPGETRDLGDIRVVKGVSIEGQVVDTLGHPVMCTLVAGDADALLEPFSTRSGVEVLSGADGTFRISEVKRGRIAIHVDRGGDKRSDRWGSQVLLVDASAGPVTGARLVLQNVKVVDLTWDLTGHVPKYCTLRILNADGFPLVSRIPMAKGHTREKLPSGTYNAILGDGVKTLSETRSEVRDTPVAVTLSGPR